MNRVFKAKCRVLKKEVWGFWELIKSRPRRLVLSGLAGLFFLSLPGQNFYQTIQVSAQPPLVRSVDFPLPSVFPYPVKTSSVTPPEISAQSAVIIDVDSKVVLWSKEPALSLQPASLTKMATALVTLENYQLEDILRVNHLYPEGAQMGLWEEEEISVENLLYGLLLPSGNDAAFVLANNFPGGVSDFVAAMNDRVGQLGLKNTHFANPTGEEDEDHYSTAWDLAHLASWAMEDPIFRRIVQTSSILVSSADQTRWHELESTNILLKEGLGIKGVKTGWTEEAGGCFIAYVERGSEKLIVVVLNSTDEESRFLDGRQLIEWALANHSWEETKD
jgi:D-alanyl-D-alanine carboxypeptidase (penicillin-binding protein 5/6)